MGLKSPLTAVTRKLRVECETGTPDSELLGRYVRNHDQGAFEALVHRYGGLVLGVARRQLAPAQPVEDVFQATFLALARSASRLHRQTPLANWLYTVALRLARKARSRAVRQFEAERAAPQRGDSSNDPLAEISGRDLLRAIDEELAQLPDQHRLPVLLCCVQGRAREEAAEQLGWSDGVLKGRLERGRRRLAERLAARGLAPSTAVLVLAATVPSPLLAQTTALATAPWSNVVPASVAALTATGSRRLVAAVLLIGSALVTGVTGWAIASSANKASTPPPVTAHSAPQPPTPEADPLPPNSTLQFGTSRFRHGTAISSLAVAQDGKFAVAASGGHIHGNVNAFDLSDGRILYSLESTLERQFRMAEAVALSPDGKTLALIGSTLSNTLHLFEAKTGKHLRQVNFPNTGGGTITSWLTFTPDGKGIALTQGDGHAVLLVDLEKAEVVRTFPHAHVVYAAAFSPDGKLMVAGGYDSDKNDYFVRLWDVSNGKELRRLRGGSGGVRTLAFAPDGKTVAGGGDGGWARIWETDTGAELQKFPKGGYRVRSLAFAPDGKTLAVAGDAIRLFDPTTGKERLRVDRQARGLCFSPDSKVLTGAVMGTIHRWDTTTGQALTPQAAGESAVDQVLVTPDGRRVITRGQDGDAHLWDARTGAHIRTLSATWQRNVALSPDGRFLVWPVADEKVKFKDPVQPNAIYTGSRLQLYDLVADKFVDRFPGFEGDAWELFFLPDGKTLLTVDRRDGAVRVWDVATGMEQRSFHVVREGEKARSHFAWGSVLSPDGRVLAVTYQPAGRGFFSPFVVRLWDVATGKELHELPGLMYYATMAFSPESRLVVIASQPLSNFAMEQLKRPANQVFVCEVANGQRVIGLPDGLPAGAVAAAFSPDGRTLTTATPEGTLQVWEVATWTLRTEFRGHRGRVNSLMYMPDGRLLSGGLDTTTLAWDTRPPTKSVVKLDAAWEALTKTEAGPAFKAQGSLVADPSEAVKRIAAQVKPVAPVATELVARLIADLDNADFAVRERATRDLGTMGQPIAGALREAVRTSGSAEVRKRAGDLLAKIERAVLTPDDLRATRALEVLEWIGTTDARAVLQTLAKGAPDATRTREAALALERLERRK